MKIFDFRCPNGHLFEAVVRDDSRNHDCECGEIAHRIISGGHTTMVSQNGWDASFPTAHDKWVREHERAGMNKESP